MKPEIRKGRRLKRETEKSEGWLRKRLKSANGGSEGRRPEKRKPENRTECRQKQENPKRWR